MKQNQCQSVDAYMSQLRLALPECNFKNDFNDLLKDQFIFGIENKEIQDQLLGEISETDSSVKALYKARKIESKLEQCKLLGIVTPDRLVDVHTVKKGKSNYYDDCKFCVNLMINESVLLMVKLATSAVVRTTLKPNVLKFKKGKKVRFENK